MLPQSDMVFENLDSVNAFFQDSSWEIPIEYEFPPIGISTDNEKIPDVVDLSNRDFGNSELQDFASILSEVDIESNENSWIHNFSNYPETSPFAQDNDNTGLFSWESIGQSKSSQNSISVPKLLQENKTRSQSFSTSDPSCASATCNTDEDVACDAVSVSQPTGTLVQSGSSESDFLLPDSWDLEDDPFSALGQRNLSTGSSAKGSKSSYKLSSHTGLIPVHSGTSTLASQSSQDADQSSSWKILEFSNMQEGNGTPLHFGNWVNENPNLETFPQPSAIEQPILVQVAKPDRPADMSARLAALVGPIGQENSRSSSYPSLPGHSVIADAIHAETVRPPSSKAKAPRVPVRRSVHSKPTGGNMFPLLEAQLGVRKPSKAGRYKRGVNAEAFATHLSQASSPRSDLSLSTSTMASSWKLPGRDSGQPVAVLKQQLIALAEAVATDEQPRVRFLTGLLKGEAQRRGSTIQRVVYCFTKALAIRTAGTGAQRYNAPVATSAEEAAQSMMVCGNRMPYVNFCLDAGNSAIMDAVLGESRVHILDLGMWQLGQWPTLMRLLAAQPGGPPHLRVTAVDCPWNGNVFKKMLVTPPAVVGREIARMAAELEIPFEFHVVKSPLENLRPFMIRQEAGEALVVSSTMRMQHLWDQTVVRSSPRDSVLQIVRQMNPKVFVMMDMDADLNTPFFMERFREALEYYHAFFEVAGMVYDDGTAYRDAFEAEYLGRDIINAVACEGMDRVIRTENLEKWQARFTRQGYSPFPFNSRTIPSLLRMLRRYTSGFSVVDRPGLGIQLLWNGRPMVSTSAWRPSF